MLITANDIRVTAGEILMPRIGAWHADILPDATSAAALVGPVVIVVGGSVTFRGTAFRTGSFRERVGVRVVGGAGGLHTVVTPTQRRGVTVGRILTGLLAEGGETLSPLSTTSILNTPMTAWAPRAGSLADAIGHLLDTATPGAAWRVLDDGTVWVGTETWLPTTANVQVLDEALTDGSQLVATDLPTLRPGTTLDGRRISAVVHRFEPERVRSSLWYEGITSTADRLKAALFGLANHALRRVDHFATYSAKVIRQMGDGRLEIRADDPRFRGLAAVAMRPGVHGITTTVRQGARILFGFENGDPRRAVATGWESGNPERLTIEADAIKLGAGAVKGIVRKDDRGYGGIVQAAGNIVTFQDPDGNVLGTLTFAIAGGAITITPSAPLGIGLITKANECSAKTTAE